LALSSTVESLWRPSALRARTGLDPTEKIDLVLESQLVRFGSRFQAFEHLTLILKVLPCLWQYFQILVYSTILTFGNHVLLLDHTADCLQSNT
jgi:hypothetical protein